MYICLMPFFLSQETVHIILKDDELMQGVSHTLGVSVLTVSGMLKRHSKMLNTYHSVLYISNYLNKSPEEILVKIDE